MNENLKAEILAAVEAGLDEQISFTQDLVKYPSVRGQEHTAQDFIYKSLAARGYAMDRWNIDVAEIEDHEGFSPVTVNYDNAVNVVGIHRPRQEAGKSLILNGHIDVVPIGPLDLWDSSPWDPRIEGDWLYGRGSGDMKAGIAANIHALDALKSLGYQPASSVYVQSVSEEECTGNGALSCLVRGYKADAAIIPEPMNNRLVRANVGVIWFQMKVRGIPVHVSDAGSGSNAIEAAYKLIEGLKPLEAEWNARKTQYPLFEKLEHPLNFNVGKIEGGDWASSVPAWCNVDMRVAIYPGVDPRDAAKEIEDCIDAVCAADPSLANMRPEIVYNGFFAEGYVLEEGSEAEQSLAKAHAASFQSSLETTISQAYLDARVMVLYGDTPCLVYGPVSDNIHGFNERVSVSSIKRVTGAIALFIADWCGLEKIRP